MSELDDLRAEVAATDRRILAAVNRRIELVREISAHKERHGIAFVDPEQERRLVAALQEANGGPLSADGVQALFEAVLALVKREL